jgi:hypothetical protein
MQRLDPSDRVGLRTVGVAQYFVGLTDFAPLNETPSPERIIDMLAKMNIPIPRGLFLGYTQT